MKMPRSFLWALLSAIGLSAPASDLIVQPGATLICRTNLTVSSGKITVNDGASMQIDNAIVTCQDFQLDPTASLTATGTIYVSSSWVNNSDFIKPATFAMSTTVSSVTEPNLATGFGDTDDDGITDYGEGSYDANGNHIADFIDAAQSAPMSHIPADWVALKGLSGNPQDDSDGDGASDWSEYHAMTEPLDSNSVLSITELIRNQPVVGDVSVTWSSVSGRSYDLQYTTNLTETVPGFVSAKSSVAGESGTTTTSVSEPTDRQGYYRIKVNP